MANPTTNYSWVLPTPTDLVTDLPADFDVALQGVDNTVKALNPETTLGDISYRSSTANTKTRLPIGSTGNVLTVSGGVPVWAAPAAGGGFTLIATGTGTGSSATITFSSIPSTYKHLMLVFEEVRTAAGDQTVKINYNGVTTTTYDFGFAGTNTTNDNGASQIYTFDTIITSAGTNSFCNGVYWVYDYAGSQNKTATGIFGKRNTDTEGFTYRTGVARWRNSAAISSIAIGNSGSSNFGTATVIKLYGVS